MFGGLFYRKFLENKKTEDKRQHNTTLYELTTVKKRWEDHGTNVKTATG